jgi:hypothetical protein
MPRWIALFQRVEAVLNRGMSLNRSEQMILDFVQSHADERQFWQDKVRSVSRGAQNHFDAVTALEPELWAYYAERSRYTEPFKGTVLREGLRRISMKSLAEHWVRLWAPPKPKKQPPKHEQLEF